MHEHGQDGGSDREQNHVTALASGRDEIPMSPFYVIYMVLLAKEGLVAELNSLLSAKVFSPPRKKKWPSPL